MELLWLLWFLWLQLLLLPLRQMSLFRLLFFPANVPAVAVVSTLVVVGVQADVIFVSTLTVTWLMWLL